MTPPLQTRPPVSEIAASLEGYNYRSEVKPDDGLTYKPPLFLRIFDNVLRQGEDTDEEVQKITFDNKRYSLCLVSATDAATEETQIFEPINLEREQDRSTAFSAHELSKGATFSDSEVWGIKPYIMNILPVIFREREWAETSASAKFALQSLTSWTPSSQTPRGVKELLRDDGQELGICETVESLGEQIDELWQDWASSQQEIPPGTLDIGVYAAITLEYDISVEDDEYHDTQCFGIFVQPFDQVAEGLKKMPSKISAPEEAMAGQ